MRIVHLSFAVLVVLLVSRVQPAAARPQYFKAWQAEYLDSPDAKADPAFAEHIRKDVKCLVCHQGKSQKNRNPYGAELAKLLGKKNEKDAAKITEAIKKLADMKSDPTKGGSKTFGQRIAAGELPGGELDALKKEPPKSAADGDAAK